jgi:hypothetical protein
MDTATFIMSGGTSPYTNIATTTGKKLYKASGTTTYGGGHGGNAILTGTSTNEALPYGSPPTYSSDP